MINLQDVRRYWKILDLNQISLFNGRAGGKAFHGANIVVAIKKEEAESFRNYTSNDVITYPYPGMSQSWIYRGSRIIKDVNLSLLHVGFAGGLIN